MADDDPKRRFQIFDGMTWPTPDPNLDWRLRFAPDSVTRQDQLYLASVLSAYDCFIKTGRAQREKVCRKLREK